MSKESSFMAASVVPTKLLHNKLIKDGKFIPLHLQIYLTNTCNINCDFCSCRDIDRTKSLTLEQIKKVIDVGYSRGTKAITISGGGEPLVHKDLNGIIKYASLKGIKVGLTTNGILLDRLEHHDNLTWCRVSSSDDRTPTYDKIRNAINLNPETDWAFAHVLTSKPDYETLNGLVSLLNSDKRITHLKLHPNLFTIKDVPLDEVKTYFNGYDNKIVYQDRENITRGSKDCYIHLVKPVISPDGVSVCCGAQYSIKGKERYIPDEMILGRVEDLENILDNQKVFKGSICDVCYYNQYNILLNKLKDKPKHKEFI